MLRDYLSTENWRLLDAALEQFIELPSSLKLVQFITLSPDSFLWKITDGERMYYLYAEDHVENLESVRGEIAPFMPNGVMLNFVPVKSPVAFEDSSPNKGDVVYRPPENEYEFATFAGQSGYDFVFLLESSENPNVPSRSAQFEKILYDSTPNPLRVARDILQFAETAALNDDYFSLSAVQSIILTLLFADLEDETMDISLIEKYVSLLEDEMTGSVKKNSSKKKQLQDQIYSQLAKASQAEINAAKHMAENMTATVTLVTAMYAMREGSDTNGIFISLVIDGDTVSYPVEHFMNHKLQEHFSSKPHINEMNITIFMPEQLGEYKCIESSVHAKRIFRKELDYLSW